MANHFAVHFRNRASGWFHSVEHVVAESADEAVKLARDAFDARNPKSTEQAADYTHVVEDLGHVAEAVAPVVKEAEPVIGEAVQDAVDV